MLNQQPVEKSKQRRDGFLDVHHIFPTIQGEGPYAGAPATFVRLAGCNLQCPLCDTDYTSQRQLWAPEFIAEDIAKVVAPNKLVVISGGEPFRQNIVPLVDLLLTDAYTVQIETNGTLPLPPEWFWSPDSRKSCIVCSPKAGKVHPRIALHANAFKYVLRAGQVDSDGLPTRALDHPVHLRVARPPAGFDGPVYVQPCDEQDVKKNADNLAACVASAFKHGYTLCLQQHKILNLE